MSFDIKLFIEEKTLLTRRKLKAYDRKFSVGQTRHEIYYRKLFIDEIR